MRRMWFGLVIAIAVASAVALEAGQDRTPYQAQGLIARWRAIVLTVFEERRASAEEPIVDSIEIVISPGAVKAVQDKANEERIKAADAVIRRFALAMIAAGEPVADGSVAITEDAIDAAFKKICPVYPFC